MAAGRKVLAALLMVLATAGAVPAALAAATHLPGAAGTALSIDEAAAVHPGRMPDLRRGATATAATPSRLRLGAADVDDPLAGPSVAAVSTAAAGDSKDPKIRQWAAWEELLSSSVIVPEPVAGANPPGSGSDLGIDDAALGGQYGLGLGAGGYGYGYGGLADDALRSTDVLAALISDEGVDAAGAPRRLLRAARSS